MAPTIFVVYIKKVTQWRKYEFYWTGGRRELAERCHFCPSLAQLLVSSVVPTEVSSRLFQRMVRELLTRTIDDSFGKANRILNLPPSFVIGINRLYSGEDA